MTAWKEAAEGDRRVVLVSGEPGIGKTRLVTEAGARARTIRARSCSGVAATRSSACRSSRSPRRCATTSHVVPRRAAARRGRSPRRRARAHRPRPRRPRARAWPSRCGPTPRPSGTACSTRSPTCSSEIVGSGAGRARARRHPLGRQAVARCCCATCCARPTPMRLLVLGTYRDTDLDRSHPLSDVLADLRREPGVERLDLQGLDAGEVAGFMERRRRSRPRRARPRPGRGAARRDRGQPVLRRRGAAAPRRVRADRPARRSLDQRRHRSPTSGIPEGVREVVGRRLSRLSDAVNHALAIAR